jgi:hypothetical protein
MAPAMPCHDHIDVLTSRLDTMTIERVFEDGLHEFITDFLTDIARLGGTDRKGLPISRLGIDPMHLKILHTTTYHFDHPVPYGLQQLRLIPKSRAGQVVKYWTMEIEGGQEQTEFNDHHQNRVTLISFDPHATSIVVHCEGEVENADLHGVIGKHGGFAPLVVFPPLDGADTRGSPMSAGSPRACARRRPRTSRGSMPCRQRILAEVPYEIGPTHAATTAEEAIEQGAGVCQDHAISSSPPRAPWATPRAMSRAT